MRRKIFILGLLSSVTLFAGASEDSYVPQKGSSVKGKMMGVNGYKFRMNSSNEKLFKDELSVLTFNVCALPGNMPKCFGGMSPAYKRKEAIADFIENHDADLVCLQEVWAPSFRKFIVQRLQEKYTYVYYKIGPPLWGLDSGLLVAAKHPVSDVLYIPYDNIGSHPDSVIHRGLFTFEIEGHRIGVTHLQAGIGSKEIRRQQIAQFPESCEVVIGDLNTRGEEEFGEFFPNYTNHYLGPPTHNERNITLDYVLTKKGISGEIVSIDNGLSDHRALSAELHFN